MDPVVATAGGRSSPGPADRLLRRPFHLLAKPTGPICNLACDYCYFLSKESLYPGDRFRMSEQVLSSYVSGLLQAHPDGPVAVAWQGGEPTLMGIDFFRRAIDLVDQHRRPAQQVEYSIQTNATLLTDEWCELFAQHRFLVGISTDGPPELHDRFRVDKHGAATSSKVLAGLERLVRHGVDVNVLCTVHRGNQDHPLDVYRYFRDDLDLRFIQFIPVVEWDCVGDGAGMDGRGRATERSVEPQAWGRFLNAVFDEWVVADVGEVFVSMFDSALGSWLGLGSSMCIFAESCGASLAVVHNGDVYSCDHFVDPDHRLGNLTESDLGVLVGSPRQAEFGHAKSVLPLRCRGCEVRFACHGECPKNRYGPGSGDDAGLNYLCAGYYSFFSHIDGPMRTMVELVRSGRSAADICEALDHARPRGQYGSSELGR